jgi:hypothetical protein
MVRTFSSLAARIVVAAGTVICESNAHQYPSLPLIKPTCVYRSVERLTPVKGQSIRTLSVTIKEATSRDASTGIGRAVWLEADDAALDVVTVVRAAVVDVLAVVRLARLLADADAIRLEVVCR